MTVLSTGTYERDNQPLPPPSYVAPFCSEGSRPHLSHKLKELLLAVRHGPGLEQVLPPVPVCRCARARDEQVQQRALQFSCNLPQVVTE